jgi:hypothetical protein
MSVYLFVPVHIVQNSKLQWGSLQWLGICENGLDLGDQRFGILSQNFSGEHIAIEIIKIDKIIH